MRRVVCLTMIAIARFLRLASFEAPKPAFHQLGCQEPGERLEPVARQALIGQVPGVAVQVVNDALRQKWIAYRRISHEVKRAFGANHSLFPEELHDLRCGSKTRAGTPRKMQGLFRSGRCKLHGGLSRGPKSEVGKARSAQNARRSSL